MVRVIQPAGFGKIQLVRVGLIPDVDEVILLSSPESMSENELIRISEMARQLGSKAHYSMKTMPVVGKDSSISNIMNILLEFKASLPQKETLLSTTGSTNRFVACLLEIFKECMTITMNRNDDTYYSSDGNTLPLLNISKEEIWPLLGLRYEKVREKHMIFHKDSIIATPSDVKLIGDKPQLTWNEKSATLTIAKQIGALCLINSEHAYKFIIPRNKFVGEDRFPMTTERPVSLNSSSSLIHNNEFFSTYPCPVFPIGALKKNDTCLHLIVNADDTTPTMYSALSHSPDQIVLWFLNSKKDIQTQLKMRGQIGMLTSYLRGDLVENLASISSDIKNQIEKSKVLNLYKIPKLNSRIHLIELNSLEQIIPSLDSDILNAKQTIFDHISGFPGLQDKIVRYLSSCGLEVKRWYSDPFLQTTEPISSTPQDKPGFQPNLTQFLLRKHIPLAGKTVSSTHTDKKLMKKLCPILLENRIINRDKKWKPRDGEFKTKEGDSVIVKSLKTQNVRTKFIASTPNGDSVEFGSIEGPHKSGQWLEDLAGHIIHQYWESKYSIIGLKSKPMLGNAETGTTDEMDNYALTPHGVIIGEAKTEKISIFGKKFQQHLGQLMGEVGVFGHRKGNIPILIIDHESNQYDEIVPAGVVVCSWWELQYPERILHRLRTGQRTPEELEAARKAAEEARLADEARLPEEARLADEARLPEEARLADEAHIAAEARREEENARKAEVLRLAQEALDAETMFSGQISLEQVENYLDSDAAIVIQGVPELDNAIISVAKSKFKVLFDPAKNRSKWSGYNVTVKSTIPKEISSRENFVKDSTAYLENLKTIESCEDE